jgi:hypothetical protein
LLSFADLGSGVEVEEFSWEDYLEETGSTTVPYASFKHVGNTPSFFFLFPFRQGVTVKPWLSWNFI